MAKTEYQKMLDLEAYSPMGPELVRLRQLAKHLLKDLNEIPSEHVDERWARMLSLLGHAGKGSWLESPFYCDYGLNIRLGEYVYVNTGCCFLDCATIAIGDRTQIGPGVHFYTVSHARSPEERNQSDTQIALPIKLGNAVWVGGGAIILPGITIGDGATIGAGSVVTHDVPAGATAVGNPCRIIQSSEVEIGSDLNRRMHRDLVA